MTGLATPTGPLRIDAPPAPSGIRLSLVVPTLNEAGNIGPMLRELARLLDGLLGAAYEIIVVDDDSPDGTWQAAAAIAAALPAVRVMRRVDERGLSTAAIRGWQAARGDVLGLIDGDLQHPPDVLASLWERIERGADLAVASRHVVGGGVSEWALWRRLVSRSAQVLGLLVLPGAVGRISDPMSGYLMVRREAIAGTVLDPLGYKVLVELLARCRPRRIAEVPYVFRERTTGTSKLTRAVYADYLRHLVRLRLATLPVRRFLRYGLVGLSGVGVDMAVLYLLGDPAMLGWGLLPSKLLAGQLALVSNFVLNDAWTFADLAAHQPGWRARLGRFAKFEGVCFAGLLLNAALLYLLVSRAGLNRYVANAVAIAAVTGWNFWLNLVISWRRTVPE